MSTEKLVNNSLFGKTELTTQKVELGLLDDLKSDVSTNGEVDSKARALVRQAYSDLGKAFELYSNMKTRNERIIKNSNKFQQSVKELGIEVTDQFQKNVIAGLYDDKNLDFKIKSVGTANSSLKGTGEI